MVEETQGAGASPGVATARAESQQGGLWKSGGAKHGMQVDAEKREANTLDRSQDMDSWRPS